jgi:hypothetical protein
MRASVPGGEGQRTVQLKFFVDGDLVAEKIDTENPLATGSVGLLVATGGTTMHPIEAEFDNFVVTRG